MSQTRCDLAVMELINTEVKTKSLNHGKRPQYLERG